MTSSPPKKDIYKDILDNVSKIYNNERKINDLILDIQRSNANLIKNQKELAKVVISIDKQQQRIINQMNFIAKLLDKLNKDTDSIKEEQIKMTESLKLCSSEETKNSEIFKMIREEILIGNKDNLLKLNKVYECLTDTGNYFHTFDSDMKSVNKLAIDYLSEIRCTLNIAKKATSPIKRPSLYDYKYDSKEEADKLKKLSKEIILPKTDQKISANDSLYNVKSNERIKRVILKEIINQSKESIKRDKIKSESNLAKQESSGRKSGRSVKKHKKGSRYKIKEKEKDNLVIKPLETLPKPQCDDYFTDDPAEECKIKTSSLKDITDQVKIFNQNLKTEKVDETMNKKEIKDDKIKEIKKESKEEIKKEDNKIITNEKEIVTKIKIDDSTDCSIELPKESFTINGSDVNKLVYGKKLNVNQSKEQNSPIDLEKFNKMSSENKMQILLSLSKEETSDSSYDKSKNGSTYESSKDISLTKSELFPRPTILETIITTTINTNDNNSNPITNTGIIEKTIETKEETKTNQDKSKEKNN